MEDLWTVQRAKTDLNEFAASAEHNLFLERFCIDEERGNRRRLLFGEECVGRPADLSRR